MERIDEAFLVCATSEVHHHGFVLFVSDGVGPGVVGTDVHVVSPRQQRGASARTTGYNWGGGGNRLGSG